MAELRRDDLDADPLRQFQRWFEQAGEAVSAPEKVALATATAGGAPSARMVLLKTADERGLTFFTHTTSRKGLELAENPRAAMLFYWEPLGRQVRIEGQVAEIDAAESDAYFETRPLGARIGANVSRQSRPLGSRTALEQLVAQFESEPSRPATWGGYRLRPEAWEFWQHRDDRLHDRFRYTRQGDAWLIERLFP
ncbi:MAG TPA: pyridoxamine 5'-phosphate oxidase [Gaiellaceae bacterium]